MSEEEKGPQINLVDNGDREEENREAEEAGVESVPVTMSQQELTESFKRLESFCSKFMDDTYTHVTNMNFRATALGNVLLKRGLVSDQELSEALEEVTATYERFMEEQVARANGQTPQTQEAQDIDKECAIDLNSSDEKQEEGCGGCAASAGRTPPRCHGG